MMNRKEETLYDVLKVDRKATISEIVAAYHSAKNAFSKDSVATYSLFSPEETKAILDRLEEAYLTLSNVDKKREYDRNLNGAEGLDGPDGAHAAPTPPPAPVPLPARPASSATPTDYGEGDGSVRKLPAKPMSPPPIEFGQGALTGAMLREAREKRTLSVEDVSRITKIPGKFIRAIESDDLRQIPARVYLQGFVKNLAVLYRLDPGAAIKAYLMHIDSLTAQAAAG